MIDILYQNVIADGYAWRTRFARFDIQPHVVEYGQLMRDPTGVVVGVLEYLVVDPASE